jgi:nitrogen fixation protein FixH
MKALLGIVVIIGIGAVVATVLIGSSTFEGIVVSNPYEEGLRWDAQQRARAESGWSVSLPSRSFPRGTTVFSATVSDRKGHPLPDAVVVLRVSYPSTSRYDEAHTLARERDGRFVGTVNLPRSGLWNVQFVVSQGGKQAVFEDSIRAE